MTEPTHRFVETNGVTLHIAEQGAGKPVVFCHGFPHTWYVWHRQLAALAAAGFHAIAPDLRGYGRSSIPEGVESYTNTAVVDDLVGLLDDIGAEKAVFVGLDFGAVLVWELALRAPERVESVVVFNNPYLGRAPFLPSDMWRRIAEKHFLHMHYFQEPGVADRELAADPRGFLQRVYYALSGEYHYLDVWQHPSAGTGYLDALPKAPPLPWIWLTEQEFDVLATDFERTGFTGGLSWYRALDLNWALAEELSDAKVTVPAYFVWGEKDCDMEGFSGRDPIGLMRAKVPDLREVVMVEGAGHLIQLEKSAEVDALLLDFLRRS